MVVLSRIPALTLVALAASPASAFAVDYLKADEAAHLMFPDADRFDAVDIQLDAGQMRKLEDAGVRARSARWQLKAARKQDVTLGWVVVDEVVGKFELITYAVGMGADGAVKQVEVLSYRESHGSEIRLPAWRKQFAGKRAGEAIEVGRDIANISGATLSCKHVTEGVKRIVEVLQLLKTEGRLR